MPDYKMNLYVDKVPVPVDVQAAQQYGFIIPPYTTAARDALVGMPAGFVIRNTTTNKLNWYTGAGWEAITSA